jgi:transposase
MRLCVILVQKPKSGAALKTISIKLSDEQRSELIQIRQKTSDYRSERALAVLHCAEGQRPCQIAAILKRSSQTICQWLHAYKKDGAEGLNRNFSPGRPSVRKAKLIPKLSEYLARSPRDYGWGEDVWSVKVIIAQYEKDHQHTISRYSVIRAFHDEGHSSKRSKKTIPEHAPSKEEKLNRVKEIAAEINALRKYGDLEIMFLDESHFSTEPYVVRGWSKRGEAFFPPDASEKRSLHDIWGIRAGKRRFLLEKFE